MNSKIQKLNVELKINYRTKREKELLKIRVRPGLNRYLLSWQESPLPLSYWPSTANRTRIGTNRLEDDGTNQLSYSRFFVRDEPNFVLYNISLIA